MTQAGGLLRRTERMLNHTIGGDVTSGYVVPTTERLREPMQRFKYWILATAGLRPTAEVVELRAGKAKERG